jgi:hypothetical protein
MLFFSLFNDFTHGFCKCFEASSSSIKEEAVSFVDALENKGSTLFKHCWCKFSFIW